VEQPGRQVVAGRREPEQREEAGEHQVSQRPPEAADVQVEQVCELALGLLGALEPDEVVEDEEARRRRAVEQGGDRRGDDEGRYRQGHAAGDAVQRRHVAVG
jgi:hypothetical protein